MPSNTLSVGQVKGYARQAGWSGAHLDIAVAVAKAESGFNARAHNPVPPDNSYGLWQINMIGELGPSRRRAYGLKSNDALYDPATNARVAYAIYKAAGRSFRPWTTYTGGSYRKFLSLAKNGEIGDVPNRDIDTEKVAEEMRETIRDGGGGILGNGLLSQLYSLNETIRKATLTWLIVIIALVLIILGIVVIIRKQAAGAIPGVAGKLAEGLVK